MAELKNKNKAISSDFSLAGGLGTRDWVFVGVAITVLILSFFAFWAAFPMERLMLIIFLITIRYTYLLFRELVLGEYNDLSGYPFSVAKYYFPDFLLTWLIYGLGANVVWGIYLWMFAVLVISLGGWLLLCDALFSPNLNRRYW